MQENEKRISKMKKIKFIENKNNEMKSKYVLR